MVEMMLIRSKNSNCCEGYAEDPDEDPEATEQKSGGVSLSRFAFFQWQEPRTVRLIAAVTAEPARRTCARFARSILNSPDKKAVPLSASYRLATSFVVAPTKVHQVVSKPSPITTDKQNFNGLTRIVDGQ